MAAARGRLRALVHHLLPQSGDKKRTEIAPEMTQRLEQAGPFPLAHDAFDKGVLPLELTRCIDRVGQPWVSELASSRPIPWPGQWRRVEAVAAALQAAPPESVRPVPVRGRHGETKQWWVFTKVGRLKRYGRKRLVRVHAQADLGDAPRFLLTEAGHWESGRVLEPWSYRWASAILHEFGKQGTGLETAQRRQEDAVKRHVRLSGVAQSLVQRAPVSGTDTDRFAFAKGEATYGQRSRTLLREALHGVRRFVAQLFAQGQSCAEVFERLMPA